MMILPFNKTEVEKLLVACHRRCSICHRFCGAKMELDHIIPKAEKGSNRIENAIPVCLECHAEIHMYNNKHPRGRKYSPNELRLHKLQWIQLCKNHPKMLVDNPRIDHSEPLLALISELEFNKEVANKISSNEIGCFFENAQFIRNIEEGTILMLDEDIKKKIFLTYYYINKSNSMLNNLVILPPQGNAYAIAKNNAQDAIIEAKNHIHDILSVMNNFLSYNQTNIS